MYRSRARFIQLPRPKEAVTRCACIGTKLARTTHLRY
jgi:hypothetical protein